MSKKEIKDYTEVQWWKGAKTAKLGIYIVAIDARAFLPFVLLIFNRSMWLLYTAIGIATFFYILDQLGMPFDVAWRRLKGFVAGRRRYVNNYKIRRKRFINGQ